MPRSLSIMPARVKLAEYEVQNWIVNAEEGTSEGDLLTPGYWAHVAHQFKPYDHIEVRVETGEWVIHLVVVGCDRNWANVVVDRKIYFVAHTESPVEVMSKHEIHEAHEVAWKGPQHKWAVIRKADSEMVNKGFSSKEEAHAWKREHENVTAPQPA
jgi:hypothetical protein